MELKWVNKHLTLHYPLDGNGKPGEPKWVEPSDLRPLRSARVDLTGSHGDPGVDPERGNWLVLGDNLLALHAIKRALGAPVVDCAYADPPYNTKNAFESYHDSFRHSEWLGMMAPRLRAIRSLLRPGGLALVQVDDEEHAHLELLMNEVFGEENRVGTIVWRRRQSQANLRGTGVAPVHDFVVVFARDASRVPESRLRALRDSLWVDPVKFGNNQAASKEVEAYFGEKRAFETPKPELLLYHLLERATSPGDLVLDPFAGSGTTLAVAHKMGRRWVGVEMNAGQFDLCRRRLAMVCSKSPPSPDARPGVSPRLGWKGGGGFFTFRLDAPDLKGRDASPPADAQAQSLSGSLELCWPERERAATLDEDGVWRWLGLNDPRLQTPRALATTRAHDGGVVSTERGGGSGSGGGDDDGEVPPPDVIVRGDPAFAVPAVTNWLLSFPGDHRAKVVLFTPPRDVSREHFPSWCRLVLEGAREALHPGGFLVARVPTALQAPVKVLLDETFGGTNRVSTIVWGTGDSWEPYELAHIYAKDAAKATFHELPPPRPENVRNFDGDPRGPWESRPLVASEKSSNKRYTYRFKNGLTLTRRFRYSEETLRRFEEEDRLYFPSPKSGPGIPRVKVFYRERLEKFLKTGKGGVTPNSLWVEDRWPKDDLGRRLCERLLRVTSIEGDRVLEVPRRSEAFRRAAVANNRRYVGVDWSFGRREKPPELAVAEPVVVFSTNGLSFTDFVKGVDPELVAETTFQAFRCRRVSRPSANDLTGPLVRRFVSAGGHLFVGRGVETGRLAVVCLKFPPTVIPREFFSDLARLGTANEGSSTSGPELDLYTNCGVAVAPWRLPGSLRLYKLPTCLARGGRSNLGVGAQLDGNAAASRTRGLRGGGADFYERLVRSPAYSKWISAAGRPASLPPGTLDHVKRNLSHVPRPYQWAAIAALDFFLRPSRANAGGASGDDDWKNDAAVEAARTAFRSELVEELGGTPTTFLGFEMATGSGKTLLMAACILYARRVLGVRNFLVLTPPSLTIYHKTVEEFTRGSPKCLFSPHGEVKYDLVTGDDFFQWSRLSDPTSDFTVYVFNVGKYFVGSRHERLVDKPWESSAWKDGAGRVVSFRDYLRALPDLVVLTDEAHHFQHFSDGHRGKNRTAGDVVVDLKPLFVLEFTATMAGGTAGRRKQKPVFRYALDRFIRDGWGKRVRAFGVKAGASRKGSEGDEPSGLLTKFDEELLLGALFVHVLKRRALGYDSNAPTARKPVLLVRARSQAHVDAISNYLASLGNKPGVVKGAWRRFSSRDRLPLVRAFPDVTADDAWRAVREVTRPENIVGIHYRNRHLVDVKTRFEGVERNRVEVVVQHEIATEGWNVPNVHVIAVTNRGSKGVRVGIRQLVGRGLRLRDGRRRRYDALPEDDPRVQTEVLHVVCDEGGSFGEFVERVRRLAEELGLDGHGDEVAVEAPANRFTARPVGLDGSPVLRRVLLPRLEFEPDVPQPTPEQLAEALEHRQRGDPGELDATGRLRLAVDSALLEVPALPVHPLVVRALAGRAVSWLNSLDGGEEIFDPRSFATEIARELDQTTLALRVAGWKALPDAFRAAPLVAVGWGTDGPGTFEKSYYCPVVFRNKSVEELARVLDGLDDVICWIHPTWWGTKDSLRGGRPRGSPGWSLPLPTGGWLAPDFLVLTSGERATRPRLVAVFLRPSAEAQSLRDLLSPFRNLKTLHGTTPENLPPGVPVESVEVLVLERGELELERGECLSLEELVKRLG
ncbi:MAG: hypothetical protein Kow0069_11960 [Promethearchaeota archaeon]